MVGSGIAGLASAWWLSRQHAVTLFERDAHLGGHTHTHDIELDGQRIAVDTGFIVFNPQHYPVLSALFAELGVASQPTTMSFSVQDARTGLEYNAGSLAGLFCQRRNLLSPRFWGLLRDLRRFYRQAPAVLDQPGGGPTLGEYLREGRYGQAFIEQHLLPMASALWSSPSTEVLAFPVRYLVRFMANHQMLQISGRTPWRVVQGGSARYVDALRARWQVDERVNCGVTEVRREAGRVWIESPLGVERFDDVVMACHSDQALALLQDAAPLEREVLGAMRYQHNEVVLHTDERLLPRNRKAWAAWNAYLPAEPGAACTVSYCMNLLQGLHEVRPLIVSLNRTHDVRPECLLRTLQYSHPVHDHAMLAAQSRWAELQGRRGTWFAGAYWGWGFHEDGIRSAQRVAHAMRERHDRGHAGNAAPSAQALPA
ncbi:hypothetical protein SAMN06296058_0236 [Pseudoxanthomonas indica]|uniref:Amine oxidase domain-containing protein n=1 Tax=Pseudoxanthomonas indica TaxID=428993 RepID=A0A1T5ITN4_9GAMM|nr:dehydrogenase [Pseudoxanthomonas indica]SKC42547.1 hypothetical protein SAMN06296058_0236 [Pseudoxanthomonas indica]